MITILDEIKTASKEVKTIFKKENITFEQQVNNLLDYLLERQREINEISGIISNLNEKVIIEIHKSKNVALEIRPDLQLLVSLCNRLIGTIKKFKFYDGVKEVIIKFQYEVRSLNETLNDIELKYIKLPANEEMKKVAEKIKASR